jgi:hypothetical protein
MEKENKKSTRKKNENQKTKKTKKNMNVVENAVNENAVNENAVNENAFPNAVAAVNENALVAEVDANTDVAEAIDENALAAENEEDYGKENDDLKEKEKKEYYANLKKPESKTDFLYPSLGNPYLNKSLSLRKEFAHLKYDGEIKDKLDIKKVSDMICKNPDFELLPHQLFVKGFMSSQTPYKSILLYHGLGSGKTCSAIGISEEMRNYTKQTGINSRIFIVASPNVQDNFRLQLFDERKLVKTNGIWSLNTCVGTQILNEINPTNSPMEQDKIISQAKTIINRDYKFMGYLQFANYIEYKINNSLSTTVEKELVKKHFSDSLVIIDEVHNCTKESKSLSVQLKKLAKHADNLRFILLSATPMYNMPREIIWITNLMNLNDGRSAIKYSEVFDEDGSLIKSKDDEGEKLLLRKLNGYVSYVRGENPYTFPFRVYPDPQQKQFTAINSGNTVDVPLQGKLHLTNIGNQQKKIYDLVVRKTLESGGGLFEIDRVAEDLENMEKYGYTKLQAPLQSLIVTFPHKDLTTIIADDHDTERYKQLFGQTGLDNVMKSETKTIKIGEASVPIKCNYEYRQGVSRIFSETMLPEYSAKISSICDCIRASANRFVDGVSIHGGIVLVYTQYIYGGIVPVALALEEMGFMRYAGKTNVPSLFKPGTIKNRIDSRTMKQKDEVPFDEFKQAKYMILSGDKHFSQDNAEDIKIATGKENMYGDEVRVILISRAASEGLDFKYIRQVHILDPWYNMNRTEQIIGRGVRNRSHCGLVFEERNVEIYLHATTNGEQETADIYVYRYAEEKAQKIGEITRLLKTVSIDCVLNHSQTNFTDKEMETVAKNGVVQIVPSTKDEMVDYKLGDKPFSSICDYMEDCNYKCYPEDAAAKIKTKNINELYDKDRISANSKQIVEKIKNIFKLENAYHFETIESMDIFQNATKEELYYSLSRLIEGPETIQDKYGRQGRLVNRGAYYIFQPMEVTNPNISLYESTIPVKTMNEYVQYEIEKTDENIRTPVFGSDENDDISESYVSLMTVIRNDLETATKDDPNKLKDKNDDWYYNLNSIKCKKDASEEKKFSEFKRLHKIVKTDGDVIVQRKLGSLYAEYKKLEKNAICTTNGFFSIMLRLRIFGFTPALIRKYVTDHILETLSHENRVILAKEVLKPGFVANDDLEKHIVSQFQDLLIDNKKVLVLTKKNENVFYRTTDWTELNFGEKNVLQPEMQKKFGINNYSDIIGFVGEFSSKDMGSLMVFKTKNMKQVRNNKGAYLQNESNKIAIVKQLNTILKLTRSPFSFDDETCNKCERNTDDISKIALACIYEMLIRKFHDDYTDKTWFVRPEHAIFNDVKNA